MQHLSRGPAGNCYFRGDLGYSVSRDPNVKWAVTNATGTFDSAAATAAGATGTYDPVTNVYTAGTGDPVGFDPTAFYATSSNYLGDSVSATSMENAWFGGVGIGCGSGSRGLRGEFMLGYTGHRKIDGQPSSDQRPASAARRRTGTACSRRPDALRRQELHRHVQRLLRSRQLGRHHAVRRRRRRRRLQSDVAKSTSPTTSTCRTRSRVTAACRSLGRSMPASAGRSRIARSSTSATAT